jgi:glycine/D-amino acid oxidase-like deaminating enzyme
MNLHTGVPFWLARRTPPPAYPTLDRDLRADVAVIGSGVTGALVAYELTAAGYDVVVVDRGDAAGGSSAASSGLLLYETDSSLDELSRHYDERFAIQVYTMGLEAVGRLEDLCRTLKTDCGFARRPTLYLASSEADVQGLRRECELRRRYRFDVEWLAPAELARRYGIAAPAALSSSGDAEIDTYAFVLAVLHDAVRRGARVYTRTAVERLEPTGAGVTVVAGAHRIAASRVVCASGYQATTWLNRPTGRLASTWAAVTRPLSRFDGWADRCLIWETARPYVYARTTDDGRALVGGGDAPGPERHDDRALLREKVKMLADRLHRLFPALDIDVEFAWGGTFATTLDGLPFIGEVAGWPNVWFALAYGGNGITFSVVAADLIREALAGRPAPDGGMLGFGRRRH